MTSRLLLLILTVACVSGATGAVTATVLLSPYGAMPHLWANWSHVSIDGGHENQLGGVVGQVSTHALPDGGPQALEGYTYVAHPSGVTRLALGTIGNVEIAGAGATQEVRSLQAGGVISGTGPVGEWVGLYISLPRAAEGQVQTYSPIKFDNGWRFVAEGEALYLCPPRGAACRAF